MSYDIAAAIIALAISGRPLLRPAKKKIFVPPAERQARGFRQAREARGSAVVEDYVELIADLRESSARPVRAVDLVKRLGVAQPTVAKMVARLRREGLIAAGARAGLELTQKGRLMAAACKKRHRIVLAFLLKLGIPLETAERDAEGIEHHVSDATLGAFEAFTRRGTRSEGAQMQLFGRDGAP